VSERDLTFATDSFVWIIYSITYIHLCFKNILSKLTARFVIITMV